MTGRKAERGRWNAVPRNLWNDLVRVDPCHRTLALYVWTCPEGHMCGVWSLSPQRAAAYLGIDEKAVSDGLQALHDADIIRWDRTWGLVLVVGYHELNQLPHRNGRISSLKHLADLPPSSLVDEVRNQLQLQLQTQIQDPAPAPAPAPGTLGGSLGQPLSQGLGEGLLQTLGRGEGSDSFGGERELEARHLADRIDRCRSEMGLGTLSTRRKARLREALTARIGEGVPPEKLKCVVIKRAEEARRAGTEGFLHAGAFEGKGWVHSLELVQSGQSQRNLNPEWTGL